MPKHHIQQGALGRHICQIVDRWARFAGLNKGNQTLSPPDLRRTAVTMALGLGFTYRHVQAMTGQKDIRMVVRYYHERGNLEENAINVLHYGISLTRRKVIRITMEKEITMKSDLNKAVYDSVIAAIRLSTVGVVFGSGDNKGQGIGTGTLICWNDRHLILTAEHVIAGTSPKDLRFILPPDSPPIEIDREKLMNLPGVRTALIREPVELELGQLVADAKLDLAAIQVNRNLAEKYSARFFNLAAGGRTPAVGRTITAIGFPYDISRITTDNRPLVSTSVEQTRVEPNREGHPGFDPAVHFLATYTEAVEYPDAEPLGMSGGPCGPLATTWHLRIARKAYGTPSSTLLASGLAGIEVRNF